MRSIVSVKCLWVSDVAILMHFSFAEDAFHFVHALQQGNSHLAPKAGVPDALGHPELLLVFVCSHSCNMKGS